ncbi:hypothetical protein [uncultured Sulfitobacter sp.]|uniref:hypothetical protein n=1 Tax=uncultured Sulfitobacter sp. TaxID=191468 RepID=UPI002608D712|nr:hypothetical protein [uncultured Sulfitobacter sp.]
MEDDFPQTNDTTGRLSVGGTATGVLEALGDVDRFAIDGIAGQTYAIEMLSAIESESGYPVIDTLIRGVFDESGTRVGRGDDDGGADTNSLTSFAPSADGTYYIDASSYAGSSIGAYELRASLAVDDFPNVPSTTGMVSIGGTVTGLGQPIGDIGTDRDWFAVSLEAGVLYRFDTDTSNVIDTPLRLYDEGGERAFRQENELLVNTLGDSMFVFATAPGDYFVEVLTFRESVSYSLSATELFRTEIDQQDTDGFPVLAAPFSGTTARGSWLDEFVLVARETDGTALLRGSAGNDTLIGSAGDDILIGDDTLDRFVSFEQDEFIYRAYQLLLDRAPDPETAAALENQSYATIVDIILRSVEFNAKNAEFDIDLAYDVDPSAFVDFLYTAMRGEAPATSNTYRQEYISRLESTGRPFSSEIDVAVSFINSQEFRNVVGGDALDFSLRDVTPDDLGPIYDMYAAVLGRTPDMFGFTQWQIETNDGLSNASLASRFLNSAEFGNMDEMSDAAFAGYILGNMGISEQVFSLQVASDLLAGGTSRDEFVNALTTLFDADGVEDWIRAEGTDDVLIGGGGNDRLLGGAFSDEFVFAPNTDGTARVMDMETWDKLDLTAFGFEDVAAARAAFDASGDDLVFAAQDTNFVVVDFTLAALSDDALLI